MNNAPLLIIGYYPICSRPIYVLISNKYYACEYSYSDYNNIPTTLI